MQKIRQRHHLDLTRLTGGVLVELQFATVDMLQRDRVVHVAGEVEDLCAPLLVAELASQIAAVVLRDHLALRIGLHALDDAGLPLHLAVDLRLLRQTVLVDLLNVVYEVFICGVRGFFRLVMVIVS